MSSRGADTSLELPPELIHELGGPSSSPSQHVRSSPHTPITYSPSLPPSIQPYYPSQPIQTLFLHTLPQK